MALTLLLCFCSLSAPLLACLSPSGPTGKILLMPEDPNSVLICVATGTGIAPFRSFWRRCFFENVPSWKFTGLLWVFMGVANSDAKLYDDEMQQITNTFPDQFRLDYALSREQQNRKGGKMYIQDKVRTTGGGGAGQSCCVGCSAADVMLLCCDARCVAVASASTAQHAHHLPSMEWHNSTKRAACL